MKVEQLKELGLNSAAEKLETCQTMTRNLAVAYEHYRVVTPEIFNRFSEALKKKTMEVVSKCTNCQGKGFVKQGIRNNLLPCFECHRHPGAEEISYDTLAFIELDKYTEIPPPDCLLDLKKAQDLKCFDEFEVAKIESVHVRPDPIIFGGIKGCVDKFFITQWDDDVKIEDILKENEG